MQNLSLSNPQYVFLNELDTKFRAYVGGFGSGKTFVGCLDLLIFAGQNPGIIQGYFGPSYRAIRDIFYPTFEEAAEMMGYRVKIAYGDKEVAIYRGLQYYGTIICRSMDNPGSIIGFKIARGLVDEIDTLPKDKARLAWQKIIARMRLVVPGVENGIGVTTTPEGFLFVYEAFEEDPKPSYSMVQASTYENEEYLPPDYIPSLLETYPEELVNAYVMGRFVNLKSGTVYYRYDRDKCRSRETIEGKETIYIGCDFNINKQAATVYVRRDGGSKWHAVSELVDMRDTPDMIKVIKDKWDPTGDREIIVYPDASGSSGSSTNASVSDIGLLESAGFEVRAHASNPAVKDRVLATNQAFAKGVLFVNDKECPTVARCYEQQAYDKNGEPDKKSGVDHQNDASTYPIAYEMPVVRPMIHTPFKFAM